MKIDQMLEISRTKAAEAQAILEGDAPDLEKANGLMDDAEKWKAQAEALKKAMSLSKKEDGDLAPSGLKVVADETDKQAKGKQWSFGELLQGIANDDMIVRPFRSNELEPGAYDIGKALGPEFTGSLYAAKAASWQKQTGLSEGVPADGGFLVGVQHNFNILSRVYNVGQLLQRVDMVPLSANNNGMTFLADAETARADGSRRGGVRYYWACEAAAKTPSHPTFRRMELSLNKIIGLVYATDELLQDATALEAYIMNILPEELRFGVEDAIVRGTGAGMPLGFLGSPCLVTQPAEVAQAADTVVAENVIGMWSRRWAGARDYVWLVNQDVVPWLIQMNLGVGLGGGALVYMPPGGLTGLPYGTLFGRPVLEVEYADTVGDVGDICLVALSEYQMIEKGGMQSASSIHVRFVNDETVFRFVYRVDGQPKWNLPLTPIYSALTQSPFVVLAAR